MAWDELPVGSEDSHDPGGLGVLSPLTHVSLPKKCCFDFGDHFFAYIADDLKNEKLSTDKIEKLFFHKFLTICLPKKTLNSFM